MYRLDGDTVQEQDVLHHIEFGPGRVSNVTADMVTVEFSGRGFARFAPDGMSGSRKVLFWHKPIILAPRKSDRPDQLAQLNAQLQGMAALVRGRTQ